ncbi:MAG: hypothetical protein R3E31_11440 [Chloroflexota bacterium]
MNGTRAASTITAFTALQWEPVDTEISRAQVRTDGQGKANASFTPQNGGSYIAIATVTDSSGHSQSSSAYLWVTDLDFIGWCSAERERSMSIVPDKQEYQPGDTAQILVQSPLPCRCRHGSPLNAVA